MEDSHPHPPSRLKGRLCRPAASPRPGFARQQLKSKNAPLPPRGRRRFINRGQPLLEPESLTPAGTPPWQRLDLGSSTPGDIRSGRPSCNPRARSASPRPVPVPPAFFLFLFPSPRHAEGMSPSWRKGPPVPEASPSLQAGHVGPRTREMKFSQRAAGVGWDSSERPQGIPESATLHRVRAALLTSSATGSRPPLTPRHPSQRSQFPKLPPSP